MQVLSSSLLKLNRGELNMQSVYFMNISVKMKYHLVLSLFSVVNFNSRWNKPFAFSNSLLVWLVYVQVHKMKKKLYLFCFVTMQSR